MRSCSIRILPHKNEQTRKARCNIYIYIFEDGRIGVSHQAPRGHDLTLIGYGELTVLQCTGINPVPSNIIVQEVMEDEKLQPLPVAKLEQCEEGEWHYLEGHE